MADMKYLNTRVQLKYDSYENWSKAENQKDLLAGEIAIAYLGPTHTTTTPDNGTHPVLFKVGPGKFNDLPWASALAADVYDWAKQAALFIDGTSATTTTSGDKTYVGNAYTSAEWDSTLNGGKGGLKLVKGTQFATKAELDAALEAFGGDLDAITDNNTKYTFEIPASGDHAGQLAVTEINYVNGTAEGTGETKYYDFVTPEELETILGDYYTKTEVDGLIQGVEAKIPTELGVMSVTGKDAINATDTKDVEVSLVLDNTGNVTLSQGANGLKAEITAVDLGLSNAMHFIGAFAEAPASPVAGDVYLNTANHKEYVYDTTSGWVELGDEGSHALKTISITGADGLTGGGTLESNREIKLSEATKASLILADNSKQKQAAVNSKFTAPAHVLSSLSQNENGDIAYEVKELTPADIGAQPAGDYALKGELPVVNNGKFTVSGTGALSGSGDMTANQSGDTTATLDVKEGGIDTARLADTAVTTAKIADHAVGAHQTKACQDYTGDDAEVWVFCCGSASTLI